MKSHVCLKNFRRWLLVFVTGVVHLSVINAQTVKYTESSRIEKKTFVLSNDKISVSVVVDSGKLSSDEMTGQEGWLKEYGTRSTPVKTDADFAMEIMWTDWQAPRFANNAENPVTLTKEDFLFDKSETKDIETGAKDLNLYFKGSNQNLFLTVTYRLEQDAFYAHRKIAVSDTGSPNHFLQKIMPRDGRVFDKPNVIKEGGFGQPIALQFGSNGVFFGYEYPAADNILQSDSKGTRISCGQEIGEKIGKAGIGSEWVVEGLSPNSYIKLWFMKYVDAIRVAPLKPYTLYNSWYDLRSPEYPKVPAENVMNEKNIFRIIGLIDRNMIEKHHIDLDAFVLDDGWDVYKSDWVLRPKEFPRGLKSISDELKKTNTNLGIWFGPIGGYSFRRQRVGWMKEHGYEVVGDQMCVGGEKYSALLTKRVSDFAEKEGVGYYKWDGFQFSCNEPDHGHPVGIYSRRAVMENVIGMVNAVRSKNPNAFLNITSGTWLSPWWVKYANQIWMQGEDYGYADVPSVSARDAAITYRDLSLYEDFKSNNFWFPIQNLMTHGIIKGNLEKLGGEEEPLDKFTNEALLYFARGVSMWELYISPDILTDGEWNAMGEAMHWAKDRFPILSTTEIIGGDPKKRETYGYAHFKGQKGIIAARNPWIVEGSLKVELAPQQGLDPAAKDLVVEKVYPNRWISPRLYRAGESFSIPLDGYETALYEIYPLSEANMPLIAGVPFELTTADGGANVYTVFDKGDGARVLNPASAGKFTSYGAPTELRTFLGGMKPQVPPVDAKSVLCKVSNREKGIVETNLTIDQSVRQGTLAFLLQPGPETKKARLPRVNVTIDGKEDTAKFERSEGQSTWYTITVSSGRHVVQAQVIPREEGKPWSYDVNCWVLCEQNQAGSLLTVESLKPIPQRPLPPKPFPPGVRMVNVRLGHGGVGGAR